MSDGYNAFANKSICWVTWTTFSSLFTYWFFSKIIKKKTIIKFLIIYLFFIIITIYGCEQWHYLYK